MKKHCKLICALLAVVMLLGAVCISPLSSLADNAVRYGDTNADGTINAKDLLLLRQYLAEWEVTIDLAAADTAYDNAINAKDLLRLRQYLAEWDLPLGPEAPPTTAPTTAALTTAATTAAPTTAAVTTAATTAATTAPPVTEDPRYPSTTYTISDLSDSMNVVGRGLLSGTRITLEMTASGFEFSADCSGDISANLFWQGGAGLLGIIIDGDFENMQTIKIDPTNATIPLVSGITPGVHTIRIVKLNEFSQNQILIRSITINGKKTGVRPVQKALKLEFYGDSITCGYGNLSTDRTSPYSTPGKSFNELEDGYKTYAAYAAAALNAEMSVCAWSGCGIKYAYNGSTSQVIGNIWDYATRIMSQTKYDFNSYDANVVVINLGTNDNSYLKNVASAADVEQMTAACKTIIDNIRSVRPNVPIFWIGGMNGAYNNANIDIAKILTDLTKEYDQFYFKGDFYTGQNGGDWHPSVADHKQAGEALAAYISDKLIG